MGPPGQTLEDWVWDLQVKHALEKSRLVEEEILSRQESRRYCYKAAPGTEQQLLLSEAMTRAAGGGEVKTGEEELLSMQEQR